MGGARETVAFGRDAVWARGEAGAVGVAIPGSGALAVLSAMVGAPTGVFDVASFIVGIPVVGVNIGLVAVPIGVRGLVPALTVGERGMVGAPVTGAAVLMGIVGAGTGGFGGPATGAEIAGVTF